MKTYLATFWNYGTKKKGGFAAVRAIKAETLEEAKRIAREEYESETLRFLDIARDPREA